MHRNENNQHYETGMICYAKREYEEAVKHFTLAISADGDPKSYLQRAKVYFYLDKNQLVIDDCEDALQFGSELVRQEAYHMLGRVCMESKDYQNALVNLNSAIQILEKNNHRVISLYYYNRGLVSSELKLTESAIVDFEKTVAICPGDLQCFSMLVSKYKRKGDKFNAFRCLVKELLNAIKQKGSVATELVAQYSKRFAVYHAEEILEMVKPLACEDAVSLLTQGKKQGSRIQKYYPVETADVAFNFKLAMAFSKHVFFKYDALDLFIKVILSEVKAKNPTEFTDRSIDQLQFYSRIDIALSVEELTYDDARLFLEQCTDKQTQLGGLCFDDDIDTLTHITNYKIFMHQPESVRLSTRGLDVLFPPVITNAGDEMISSASVLDEKIVFRQ